MSDIALAEKRLMNLGGHAKTPKPIAEDLACLLTHYAALRAQVQDWLAANAPGGWIDDLRAQVAALTAERDKLA